MRSCACSFYGRLHKSPHFVEEDACIHSVMLVPFQIVCIYAPADLSGRRSCRWYCAFVFFQFSTIVSFEARLSKDMALLSLSRERPGAVCYAEQICIFQGARHMGVDEQVVTVVMLHPCLNLLLFVRTPHTSESVREKSFMNRTAEQVYGAAVSVHQD